MEALLASLRWSSVEQQAVRVSHRKSPASIVLMREYANSGKRWGALVAVTLFVFQALIASFALASPGLTSTGATTIICTASGPRVVTQDAEGSMPGTKQHSGVLSHCCTAGCAMLGGIVLPGLFATAGVLPATESVVRTSVTTPQFSGCLARLLQQSRAPPALV